MGMTAGGSGDGPRSDINVTPLVDVCLVLLIIFMVVTPMLQRSKEVQLPQARHFDEGAKEEDPLTLAITVDEKIWLGNAAITLAEVPAVVQDALKRSPDRVVVIKGDARLTMRQVREVMQKVQDAGAKSVGLGVDVAKPEGAP